MSAPSLIFDTCCGCIELRSGCLIIGYFQLVPEVIINLVVLSLLLQGGAEVVSGEEDTQGMSGGLIFMCILLMLFLAMLLGFTITLLVGIHKEKRGHVKAYLIYSAVFLVLSVIMFFASLAEPITSSSIFSNLVGLTIHTYFFLVIRSYYFKMDDPTKGAIYNTA